MPIRQDYYNQVVANPDQATQPGITQRVQDTAAGDTNVRKVNVTAAAALKSTEPAEEEGGFINSARAHSRAEHQGRGPTRRGLPGADRDNGVKQLGQRIIDANPTAVNSLEAIADKPGTAFAEATGNAVPSMGGMVVLVQ